MSALRNAWNDRRTRIFIIGLVALVAIGVAIRLAGVGSSSDQTDDAFFHELAMNSALTNVDDTAISDETYRRAGHAFCDDLDRGRGASAEFEAEVDVIASRFLSGARRMQANLPYSAEQQDDAPAVVAQAVGTAAVKGFCPSHSRALD